MDDDVHGTIIVDLRRGPPSTCDADFRQQVTPRGGRSGPRPRSCRQTGVGPVAGQIEAGDRRRRTRPRRLAGRQRKRRAMLAHDDRSQQLPRRRLAAARARAAAPPARRARRCPSRRDRRRRSRRATDAPPARRRSRSCRTPSASGRRSGRRSDPSSPDRRTTRLTVTIGELRIAPAASAIALSTAGGSPVQILANACHGTALITIGASTTTAPVVAPEMRPRSSRRTRAGDLARTRPPRASTKRCAGTAYSSSSGTSASRSRRPRRVGRTARRARGRTARRGDNRRLIERRERERMPQPLAQLRRLLAARAASRRPSSVDRHPRRSPPRRLSAPAGATARASMHLPIAATAAPSTSVRHQPDATAAATRDTRARCARPRPTTTARRSCRSSGASASAPISRRNA